LVQLYLVCFKQPDHFGDVVRFQLAIRVVATIKAATEKIGQFWVRDLFMSATFAIAHAKPEGLEKLPKL
jgi:hypothetical protein